MILERDPVCEHKLRLQRITIVRLVESIYANLHPFGYYAIHKLTLYVKIKKKADVRKSSLILRPEQKSCPHEDSSCKRRRNWPRDYGCRTQDIQCQQSTSSIRVR